MSVSTAGLAISRGGGRPGDRGTEGRQYSAPVQTRRSLLRVPTFRFWSLTDPCRTAVRIAHPPRQIYARLPAADVCKMRLLPLQLLASVLQIQPTCVTGDICWTFHRGHVRHKKRGQAEHH